MYLLIPRGYHVLNIAVLICTGMLLITIPGACGRDKGQPASEMTFRVDTTLLGDRFIDSGISLRAPRDWEPLPDSVVSRAMAAVSGEAAFDAARNPSVRACFGPTSEGAMLAVSDYREASAMATPDSVTSYIRNALSRQGGSVQTQEDTFSYHGFFVRQWRRAGEDTITFKLVLSQPGGPIYQLDYTLPLAAVGQEMPKVESSIGSLVTAP